MTTKEIFNEIKGVAENYEHQGQSVIITDINQGLYTDLELDSLAIVEICMLLEESFKVEFDDECITKFKTVKNIVDYLEKLLS